VNVRRREIFGWAMYDFANSAYTTVIVTVVYSVVFPKLIVGDAPEFRLGNGLWSVTLALGYALCLPTLPLLGAVMDHVGHRKRWLLASTLVTVGATAALWWVEPGQVALAMILLVVSNFGFSVGESFIASFLPDLGPPDSLGRISGGAWALGYVGGLSSTALVLFGLGPLEADNFERLRWIGPLTAGWFALAAVPTFLLLRDRGLPRPLAAGASLIGSALSQVRSTLSLLPKLRDLSFFLLSYLAAMAGLSIVVSFAFIYGDQVIGWSASTQALMFVLTQISATLGAVGFGFLQGWLGDKPTFGLTLVVWLLAVVSIWATPLLGVQLSGTGLDPEQIFLGVGVVAGLCLGATQSAGRSIIGVLAPADRVGELFGLWGVAGKMAAILGLLSLGALQAALGLRLAVLVTAVFFLVGLGLLLPVNVARGRQAAASPLV
jgi:UMF1 family MFS transporter